MDKSLQHLYKLPFKDTKFVPSLRKSSKRIYPGKIVQSPSKFNSLRSYSLSKANRSKGLQSINLKKSILNEIREISLTPELKIKKSDLYIDTSPSPKIRLPVQLPSLSTYTETEDSVELFKRSKKSMTPNGILIERDEKSQNNQETQTDCLINGKFPTLSSIKSRKPKGTVLKGKDIDQLLESFPASPSPDPKSPKESRFYRKLKKVKTFKDP